LTPAADLDRAEMCSRQVICFLQPLLNTDG
jgi:hypothetical protein